MKVSVAMATYNGMPYVSEQIESILSQTRMPNELIICDDGSTDGTRQVLREYNAAYPDIIDLRINNSNLGITKNFEKAMLSCSGDAVALSDQDDVWRPNKLERQIKVFKENNCDLVFHNSLVVNRSLQPIVDWWKLKEYEYETSQKPKQIFEELIKENFINGSTIMVDSEFIDSITPIPEYWEHDYYIVLQAAIKTGMSDINEKLNLYRRHSNQGSNFSTKSKTTYVMRGIRQGFNPDSIYKKYKKFDALHNEIDDIDWETTIIDRNFVYNNLEDRVNYEKNRYDIYNNEEKFKDKLVLALRNYNLGYYSKFGDLPPELLLTKDFIASVNGLRSWEGDC